MSSDFIDTDAAATMLSVTTRTILNLRRSGRLPFQKEGTKVSFRRSHVTALLKAVAPAEAAKVWTRDARELPPFIQREPSRRAVFVD
jgi:excisionase family DNA binding protein